MPLTEVLATDKALHFLGGLVVAGLVASVVGTSWAPAWGALAGVLVGLAKEGVDAAGLGTVEWLDFAATATGAILGGLLFFLGSS